LRLEGVLTLTGWRDDVPRLMRAFDVLVLTSLHEGLPMVLPQAMASGVPVVVSNVDGAKDIIRDGVNGYLVKPKDIDTFAERILELLDTPPLAARFAKSALPIAEEFDINKMVKEQSDFYKKICCYKI